MRRFILLLVSVLISVNAICNEFDVKIKQVDSLLRFYKTDTCIHILNNINQNRLNGKELIMLFEKYAYVYQFKGDLYVSSDYYKKMYKSAVVYSDTAKIFKSLVRLMNINSNQKNIDEFQRYYDMAGEYVTSVKSDADLSRFYMFSGLMFSSMGVNSEASDYLNKALVHARKADQKPLLSSALNNAAVHAKECKDFEKALMLYDEAISLTKDNKSHVSHPYKLYNKAIVYRDMDNIEQAMLYAQKAYNLFKSRGDNMGIVISALFIGSIYTKERKLNIAWPYLEESSRLNSRIGDRRFMALGAQEKALYYAQRNDIDSVYRYILAISSYKDSIHKMYNAKAFAGVYSRLKIKETENELISLNAKNKVITMRTIYGSVLVLILIITGSVIVRFRNQRIKREKELADARNKLIEAELHEKEQEKKLVEKELELQNREMLDFAMHVSHNNNILNYTVNLLKTIDNKRHSEQIKDIIIQINNRLAEDKDYNMYKMKSEDINRKFIKILDDKASLSEPQKQLCILIKSGLSTKEIAGILNTSVKSVEMMRYRLRKKFDISGDTDLGDFLTSL